RFGNADPGGPGRHGGAVHLSDRIAPPTNARTPPTRRPDNAPPRGVSRWSERAAARRHDHRCPTDLRVHAVTLTELVELPAGSFRMGSTDFYAEEAPVRTVSVEGFAIELHPVTNVQFAEFVSATAYVTIAEQKPDPAMYPGVDPDELRAGAL